MVICAGDSCAIWDYSARDDGTEKFAALREFKRFEAAAERIEEDPAGGIELGRRPLLDSNVD